MPNGARYHYCASCLFGEVYIQTFLPAFCFVFLIGSFAILGSVICMCYMHSFVYVSSLDKLF